MKVILGNVKTVNLTLYISSWWTKYRNISLKLKLGLLIASNIIIINLSSISFECFVKIIFENYYRKMRDWKEYEKSHLMIRFKSALHCSAFRPRKSNKRHCIKSISRIFVLYIVTWGIFDMLESSFSKASNEIQKHSIMSLNRNNKLLW